MRIAETLRVAGVIGASFAALASATAPKPPPAGQVKRTQEIAGTFDSVWNGLIDLFGERDWKIDKVEKASGIITTDWMSLSDTDAATFADCGSAPLASSTTTIRFNVVVRDSGGGTTTIVVNPTFRQIRRFDNQVGTIDCFSKGVVEQLVQTEVARRSSRAPKKTNPDERKTVFGDKPLHCLVTAEDVGECWLDAAACSNAGDSASGSASTCEMKTAGSCFNATKTLDGTKKTVCAVSIKDCETRRDAFVTNPDYSVTKCGIYRVGSN